MAVRNFVFTWGNKTSNLMGNRTSPSSKAMKTFLVMPLTTTISIRDNSTLPINKNLTLITKDKIDRESAKVDNKTLKLHLENNATSRPLVVMLSWLMAKRKYVFKYANIYTEKGFDVLNVSVNPWEMMWPVTGTQVIAGDILKFLDTNTSYGPLLLHGFSVGGYMWGEVMVKIAAEMNRYQHVVDRVSGQVWDSAADITEISIGLPVAVFPKNILLQSTFRQYILYHMKTFNKIATQHYVRSSQMFHTNIIKAPALFLLSKSDPIGAERSNQRVRDNWETIGIPVYWKCWDRSPHVGHFRYHTKEYLSEINTFLDTIGLAEPRKSEKQSKEQRIIVEN